MDKYSRFYSQTVTNELHAHIRREMFVELKSECFSGFLEIADRQFFGGVTLMFCAVRVQTEMQRTLVSKPVTLSTTIYPENSL